MLNENQNSEEELYTPKMLAAKENVSVASIYNWIHKGLPFRRRGAKGSVLISFKDYTDWMIESANQLNTTGRGFVTNVPVWAIRKSREK